MTKERLLKVGLATAVVLAGAGLIVAQGPARPSCPATGAGADAGGCCPGGATAGACPTGAQTGACPVGATALGGRGAGGACSGGCPLQVLLQAKTLGLNAEQAAKIKSIIAEAQQKVQAVLTPDQAARFAALAGSTASCPPGCTKPCCAQPAAQAQTTCPVMGGPIDKTLFVEYQGKKVYFCCPGCVQKFQANPQAYLGKLPQFQS